MFGKHKESINPKKKNAFPRGLNNFPLLRFKQRCKSLAVNDAISSSHAQPKPLGLEIWICSRAAARSWQLHIDTGFESFAAIEDEGRAKLDGTSRRLIKHGL